MQGMDRRQFLLRTGLALSAGVLAGSLPLPKVLAQSSPPPRLDAWEAVRDQFLLKRDWIHMAGFLLSSHPAPVREAIERHRRGLDEDPASYWFEHEEPAEAEVLRAAAGYLGAQPTDIALTDSTTMGLGLLYGGLTLWPGQEILSTIHDHYSTETSLRHRAERTSASFRQIPLYKNLPAVSSDELVESLVKAVRPNTRYVAVTWVHSSTGLKLPIRAMADALAAINAKRNEKDQVIFCVDGVHGFGVENVTMADLGCDFFTAGCHKWLFGPRGTGLVWGHPRAWPSAHATIPTFNNDAYRIWMKELPPREVPRAAAMTPGGFHSFEHRWALDEAFKFHLAIGKDRVAARIHELNRQLKEGLAGMKHVTLHTPMADNLSAGIVCFEVDGMSPEQIVQALRRKLILASVTPYATKYARLSPSLLTSPEEGDRTLAAVQRLAG